MSHRAKANAKRRTMEEAEHLQGARRRRRRMFVAAAIVAIFVVAFVAVGATILNQPPGARVGVSKGQVAPDFSLTDVDGNVFRLSDARGAVVLLDFMGSRCSTCVLEMPHLVETYDRFAAQGLVMLSIDVGGPLGTEDPEVARHFLRSQGGEWPIALDTAGVGITYQATSVLPTLYLIDGDGVVALRHPGIMDSGRLAEEIGRLL